MRQKIRWSANLAYAVGLITTDGCLIQIPGKYPINLTSKDLDQIQNFAKIFKLNNKVSLKSSSYTKKKIYYQITFGDKSLYKFLLKIGLTPRKSRTLGALIIPNKFFRDFLRGHLDGDGTILTYWDQYNTYRKVGYRNLRVYSYFISSSKRHLLWLLKSIRKNLGLKGTLFHNRKKPNSFMWQIKFSKKESLKLIKLLYYKPNLPSLERKRILAMQILELAALEKRKVYTKIP